MNLNNKVQKAIYENIVEPALNERMLDTVGTVLRFDRDEYCADVEIYHQQTGKREILKDVPVTQPVEGGKSGRFLMEGDHVLVTFYGGRGSFPRIIGKELRSYDDYRREMRTEKGTHVSDAYGHFG